MVPSKKDDSNLQDFAGVKTCWKGEYYNMFEQTFQLLRPPWPKKHVGDDTIDDVRRGIPQPQRWKDEMLKDVERPLQGNRSPVTRMGLLSM